MSNNNDFNDNNIGVIIINSDKEKINKLKEKWQKVKINGEKLEKISTSGFVVSMLSPFDFEGPMIELITIIIAVVGFVMKRKATNELGKIDVCDHIEMDEMDKEVLIRTTDNINKLILKRKKR